jgi:Lanthionine synthetase C-like protein.
MKNKEILQRITDNLIFNVSSIDNIGLLNGKMGIAIFFYHYGRYSRDERYLDIADELLDSVYSNSKSMLDLSFDQGILGIAWSIRYLIKQDFVEGDPEIILSEIESILFKNNISDSQSKTSISALGMYLHSIIEDMHDIDRYHSLIMFTLNKYEFYFLCLSIKPKSINYINSALLLLSTLHKHSRYKIHVDRIIFKIVLYLSSLESLDEFDACDLKILHHLLNSINSSLEEQWDIMTKIEVIDCQSNLVCINNLWKNTFLLKGEKICFDVNEIDNYVNENSNSCSLGIEGLAGIGLSVMIHNENV